MTQQLARVFEAAIGRHPEEWRILRKVFVADLDPDRLAQLRRNRDAAGESQSGKASQPYPVGP